MLLHSTLMTMGYTQFQTDNCIYKINRTINGTSNVLYLGVYVDDILCLGTTPDVIKWFRNMLSKTYTIRLIYK
jgi:hypothetical protein